MKGCKHRWALGFPDRGYFIRIGSFSGDSYSGMVPMGKDCVVLRCRDYERVSSGVHAFKLMLHGRTRGPPSRSLGTKLWGHGR